MKNLQLSAKGLRSIFSGERGRLLMLFGIEGMLFQFVMSLSGVSGFGTNLYATNLGATDSQIGMIQLVANLFAVSFLIPMGIVADRTKNAKTVPVLLLLFMGVAYLFHGTVPVMGSARIFSRSAVRPDPSNASVFASTSAAICPLSSATYPFETKPSLLPSLI